MKLLPTCDLCEEPFRDESDRHILRTDTAELTIHKACAMQLWRGVWDKQEELTAKGLMTGGLHAEVNTNVCLICNGHVWEGPTVNMDGLKFQVHEGCYSQVEPAMAKADVPERIRMSIIDNPLAKTAYADGWAMDENKQWVRTAIPVMSKHYTPKEN